jgi:hypothetical protein
MLDGEEENALFVGIVYELRNGGSVGLLLL